jgi:hypothetical protein
MTFKMKLESQKKKVIVNHNQANSTAHNEAHLTRLTKLKKKKEPKEKKANKSLQGTVSGGPPAVC